MVDSQLATLDRIDPTALIINENIFTSPRSVSLLIIDRNIHFLALRLNGFLEDFLALPFFAFAGDFLPLPVATNGLLFFLVPPGDCACVRYFPVWYHRRNVRAFRGASVGFAAARENFETFCCVGGT